MTLFWIGVSVGCIVMVVYVTLAVREFGRVRRLLDVAAGEGLSAAHEDWEFDVDQLDAGDETRRFAWKAAAAVCASIGSLILVSQLSWAWYLYPFLTTGTAVAVCVAFLIDPTNVSDGVKRLRQEARLPEHIEHERIALGSSLET